MSHLGVTCKSKYIDGDDGVRNLLLEFGTKTFWPKRTAGLSDRIERVLRIACSHLRNRLESILSGGPVGMCCGRSGLGLSAQCLPSSCIALSLGERTGCSSGRNQSHGLFPAA